MHCWWGILSGAVYATLYEGMKWSKGKRVHTEPEENISRATSRSSKATCTRNCNLLKTLFPYSLPKTTAIFKISQLNARIRGANEHEKSETLKAKLKRLRPLRPGGSDIRAGPAGAPAAACGRPYGANLRATPRPWRSPTRSTPSGARPARPAGHRKERRVFRNVTSAS